MRANGRHLLLSSGVSFLVTTALFVGYTVADEVNVNLSGLSLELFGAQINADGLQTTMQLSNTDAVKKCYLAAPGYAPFVVFRDSITGLDLATGGEYDSFSHVYDSGDFQGADASDWPSDWTVETLSPGGKVPLVVQSSKLKDPALFDQNGNWVSEFIDRDKIELSGRMAIVDCDLSGDPKRAFLTSTEIGSRNSLIVPADSNLFDLTGE